MTGRSEETLAAVDAAVRAHLEQIDPTEDGVEHSVVTGWMVLAEVTGFRDNDTMYRNDYFGEASPNQMMGLVSWGEGAVYGQAFPDDDEDD